MEDGKERKNGEDVIAIVIAQRRYREKKIPFVEQLKKSLDSLPREIKIDFYLTPEDSVKIISESTNPQNDPILKEISRISVSYGINIIFSAYRYSPTGNTKEDNQMFTCAVLFSRISGEYFVHHMRENHPFIPGTDSAIFKLPEYPFKISILICIEVEHSLVRPIILNACPDPKPKIIFNPSYIECFSNSPNSKSSSESISKKLEKACVERNMWIIRCDHPHPKGQSTSQVISPYHTSYFNFDGNSELFMYQIEFKNSRNEVRDFKSNLNWDRDEREDNLQNTGPRFKVWDINLSLSEDDNENEKKFDFYFPSRSLIIQNKNEISVFDFLSNKESLIFNIHPKLQEFETEKNILVSLENNLVLCVIPSYHIIQSCIMNNKNKLRIKIESNKLFKFSENNDLKNLTFSHDRKLVYLIEFSNNNNKYFLNRIPVSKITSMESENEEDGFINFRISPKYRSEIMFPQNNNKKTKIMKFLNPSKNLFVTHSLTEEKEETEGEKEKEEIIVWREEDNILKPQKRIFISCFVEIMEIKWVRESLYYSIIIKNKENENDKKFRIFRVSVENKTEMMFEKDIDNNQNNIYKFIPFYELNKVLLMDSRRRKLELYDSKKNIVLFDFSSEFYDVKVDENIQYLKFNDKNVIVFKIGMRLKIIKFCRNDKDIDLNEILREC